VGTVPFRAARLLKAKDKDNPGARHGQEPARHEIAAGTVARCVLPWIPLLSGGGEPGIIDRWLELAGAEPDARRRADYGGLALVFSDAAGCRAAWHRALEGWNMIQSQTVLEWMAQAEAKALLVVLESRFSAVPEALAARIKSTTDSGQLDQWVRIAATARSLKAFRRATGL
jgi:hypothetical protein